MKDQDERVIVLVEEKQPGAQRGLVLEHEWLAQRLQGVLTNQCCSGRDCDQTAIHMLKSGPGLAGCLSAAFGEGGSEDLVAGAEHSEARLQRIGAERARQAGHFEHVIN